MHTVVTSSSKTNTVTGSAPAHRCAAAAALANPLYRQRKVRSAKAYRRHAKHKGRFE